MKKYFDQYRLFLIFLVSFFGSYILLTISYQLFLSSFDTNHIDTITKVVGQNTNTLLSSFTQSVSMQYPSIDPFVNVYFKNKGIVRIVEGCNGMSVIILFIAFVVAFSGSLKNTLLFVFGGSLLIYILNLFRIAILIILLYHFPEQNHLLHGVLFPALIYGSVFVLWFIWVNKFSRYAK